MHICKWHLHHTHICGFPHISGDILYKTTQAEIPWIHQLRYQIQHDEYFTMNGSAAWRAAFPPCPKRATQVRHEEMCCTRHMQCDNHTASNNAIQKVDECKINLYLVPSLASAALMCVCIWDHVISLQDFIYIRNLKYFLACKGDNSVAGCDRQGWILLSILRLPLQCTHSIFI